MNVWVILVLMTLVAGMNMISGLLIIIHEKTNMIGILKAIGARDASVRKFIDLDNPDLPAGLQIIVAAGHPIDTAAIVETSIQPEELP